MNRWMVSFLFSAILMVTSATAQQAEHPAGPPSGNGQAQGERGAATMRFNGVGGAITAIKDDVITLKTRNGDEAKVKVSDKTEYRKDQSAVAKLGDFKVGDFIIVAGEHEESGTWNARLVASRPAGGGGVMIGGPGGGMQQMMAEGLGKVFIVGKVKEINGTKLTIDRPDSQTQVIEVDENTSFRKKGESITLADIKAGDDVLGRGALKNDVFVPTILTVVDPNQMRIQTAPRQ